MKFIINKASHRPKDGDILFDPRCIRFDWQMRLNGTLYADLSENEKPEKTIKAQYIELSPSELIDFINIHGTCVISPIKIKTSSFPNELLGKILIYDDFIE